MAEKAKRERVRLNLGRVNPDDKEGMVALCIKLARDLSGRDPTREEINATRARFGLPPLAE